MTGTKTVAERLREAEGLCETHGLCGIILYVVNGEKHCPPTESCAECKKDIIKTLARQIEAEQRSKTEQNGVDVDALLKLAGDMFQYSRLTTGGEDIRRWARTIRTAVKGAKPQLPEGIVWPTYEDGELVKPFDKLPGFDSGGVHKFIWTSSHNGDWQLQDAEGHMLNVMHGEPVKRPDPDTLESIFSEMVSVIESGGCVDLALYVERYRKLKGGE